MDNNGMNNNGLAGGDTPNTGDASAAMSNVAPTAAPVQGTPVGSAPVNMGSPVIGGQPAGGMSPVPSGQKKANGKLIALVIAVLVVLVAAVVTLVIVLINNNSSKSQSNKGGSHYEEDEKDDKTSKDDESGWQSDDDDADSISCLGYQFEKQSGYSYVCHSDALEVSSSSFAMYLEKSDGMSYYQAESHVDELAAQLNKQATVKSHRKYTTSSGKKMLVFDVVRSGTNMYVFVTAASASEVLVGQVVSESGRPTTADLETAAGLLNESTVSSRLPENESEDEGDLPEIDWNQYLGVPEVQK